MRTSVITATAVAVLGLALAGCGSEDGASGSESTATTPASPGGGTVASCLVGQWRSTGVAERAGADPASITLTGGADIGLSVEEAGQTTIDFSEMAPIEFSGEVAGAQAAGSLSYDGQGSATVQTGSDAESGQWQPTETDWSAVTVTLDVTEPVAGRPLDNAPIGDAVQNLDDLAGDVVDVDPVLGSGDYQCQGDTLVINGAGDTGISWTFNRA